MTSEEIAIRQNDVEMLSIQYAARKYYNIAEIQNYIIWLLVLIAAIAGLPLNLPTILQATIVIVTALAIFILEFAKDKNISRAADLREYFDHYVFELPYEKRNEAYLREIADIIIQKHSEEYNVQVSNTAKDNPPGVRNWYSSVYIDTCKLNPVFNCQRENEYWDSRMSKFSQWICYTVSLGLFLIFLIICKSKSFCDILAIAAAFTGIITMLVMKICNWKKYNTQSIRIKAIIESYEDYADGKGTINLQCAIDERRHLPVVHISLIHRRIAHKLHESYARIN